MAKIPFGDASFEPYIDRRADSDPLLAEIAQCAYDGVPMRPALASWFYAAWRQGRCRCIVGSQGLLDLLGFFGPIIPGKMALRQRGVHEEESIQRRANGRGIARG